MNRKIVEKVSRVEFDPQRLRQARKRAFPDLTMEEVGRTLFGLKKQNMSHYETGFSRPDPTTLLKMLIAYNVSPVDLSVQAESKKN